MTSVILIFVSIVASIVMASILNSSDNNLYTVYLNWLKEKDFHHYCRWGCRYKTNMWSMELLTFGQKGVTFHWHISNFSNILSWWPLNIINSVWPTRKWKWSKYVENHSTLLKVLYQPNSESDLHILKTALSLPFNIIERVTISKVMTKKICNPQSTKIQEVFQKMMHYFPISDSRPKFNI